MPTLNAENLYHIRVYGCIAETQSIINDFYYKVSGPAVGTTTFNDFLTAFRTIYRNDVLPIMPQSYFVKEYVLTEIVGNVPSKFDPMGNPIAWKTECFGRDFLVGVLVDDQGQILPPAEYLPPNNAALLYYRVPECGHDSVGRLFISPVMEGDQANGFLTPAAVTAYLAAYANLVTNPLVIVPVDQAVAVHVLFRRTRYNKQQRDSPPAGEFTPVTPTVGMLNPVSRRDTRSFKTSVFCG